MIKNFIKWASVAVSTMLVMSLAVSCEELDSEDQNSDDPSSVEETSTISVDPASVSVDAAGDVISIAVSSNTSWTASSNQSWAELSSTSGSEDGTISITVAANADDEERSATITLSTTDKAASATVVLTQAAVEKPYLYLESTWFLAATKGETITVKVYSNTAWTVALAEDQEAEWISSFSPTSGEGNAEITVVVVENDTEYYREAVYTFESADDSVEEVELTIAQKPYPIEYPYDTQMSGDLNAWGAWLQNWALSDRLPAVDHLYVVVYFEGYITEDVSDGNGGTYTATPQIKLGGWEVDTWTCSAFSNGWLDGYYVGEDQVWCFELTSDEYAWLNTNGGIFCQGTCAIINQVIITDTAVESTPEGEKPEEEVEAEVEEGGSASTNPLTGTDGGSY